MPLLYLSNNDITCVTMADGIIQRSLKTHYTIVQISQLVGLPEKRLKMAFKQIYGRGLYEHLRELRLQKAKELLIEGIAIKMIIREIGYKSDSHFSAAFTRWYGESPGAFRKKLPRAV